MAANKTLPTGVSVDSFIAQVADPVRRADALALRSMIERLSGHPATMWGPSIVGFGEYGYRYDSGHSGRMARIGFSPRDRELVLYLVNGYDGQDEQLARLGKHRLSKACLYIRRLADIDMSVLEDMTRDSLARMRERYPEGA